MWFNTPRDASLLPDEIFGGGWSDGSGSEDDCGSMAGSVDIASDRVRPGRWKITRIGDVSSESGSTNSGSDSDVSTRVIDTAKPITSTDDYDHAPQPITLPDQVEEASPPEANPRTQQSDRSVVGGGRGSIARNSHADLPLQLQNAFILACGTLIVSLLGGVVAVVDVR